MGDPDRRHCRRWRRTKLFHRHGRQAAERWAPADRPSGTSHRGRSSCRSRWWRRSCSDRSIRASALRVRRKNHGSCDPSRRSLERPACRPVTRACAVLELVGRGNSVRVYAAVDRRARGQDIRGGRANRSGRITGAPRSRRDRKRRRHRRRCRLRQSRRRTSVPVRLPRRMVGSPILSYSTSRLPSFTPT